MTREQAVEAIHGTELHFGECQNIIGPRGGVKELRAKWRVSGRCKTWKRRPEDFRLPIKHGLYRHGYVEPFNVKQFHLVIYCQPTFQMG